LYGRRRSADGDLRQERPIVGTNCTTQDITVMPLTKTNMWGGDWKIDFTSLRTAYFDSIATSRVWGVDFIKVTASTENIPDVRACRRRSTRADARCG